MKKIILLALPALFFAGLFNLPLHAEEGMFPLSEIHKLDLKAWGFSIESREIYNPSGVSLIDGIINLGGCTASFVSADGLILTNYHCAFGAVQAVTTPENDYLSDGFFAADRSAEIPARRYTVRLIESYRDVSRADPGRGQKENDLRPAQQGHRRKNKPHGRCFREKQSRQAGRDRRNVPRQDLCHVHL